MGHHLHREERTDQDPRVSNFIPDTWQVRANYSPIPYPGKEFSYIRVATAQGKQGIWFLLFPDGKHREFCCNTGKFFRHGENI